MRYTPDPPQNTLPTEPPQHEVTPSTDADLSHLEKNRMVDYSRLYVTSELIINSGSQDSASMLSYVAAANGIGGEAQGASS